jgi:polyphenol oxidase
MTVDSPTCFHGASFCAAAADKRAKGSLENGGHTAAHIWVGGDMGNLKTAARDPIFYTNHANVDRLWHLWSTKLGGANPMDDKEWLATSFVFYDEQKRPVRITVNDVVDVKNLGYTYEKRDRVEWLDKRPKPAKGVVRTGSASVPFPLVPRIPASPTSFSNPITLKKGKNEYVKVERPEKARAGGLKPLEVLVVDMVVDPCDAANFKVLVNVPEGQEDKVGPNNSEYVGSFTQVPHGSGAGGMMDPVKVSHRFRLGELMEDLKSSGDDRYLNVTLVPVDGMNTVIKGMHVETLC